MVCGNGWGDGASTYSSIPRNLGSSTQAGVAAEICPTPGGYSTNCLCCLHPAPDGGKLQSSIPMHDDDNLNDGLSADSTVNRRDFLKGGSAATLMTLLGGTELFAQTNAPPSGETKHVGPKIKVGVIGLGSWGRDILNTLGSLEQADIAAICDHYPGALKRCASAAPGAAQSADYKAVLDNKDIRAVIVATPTHQHKDIALAALQAGKHVYCEAPLAATIEEARVIARAAREAPQQVFQCGM